MAIDGVIIENFKGVAAKVDIPIRPITIFFGANSSGKSTCIHAVAALSQTVKIAGNRQPLILDDEYSQIHLGRFIEAIHDKNYTSALRLGIILPKMLIPKAEKGEDGMTGAESECRVEISVSCTRRTQDIRIDAVEYIFDWDTVKIARKGQHKYQLTSKLLNYSVEVVRKEAWFFAISLSKMGTAEPAAIQDFARMSVLLDVLQDAVRGELKRTLYLGPFRQSPQRRYPTRGAMPSEVGPMGESTITLLANEHVQSRSRVHITKVSEWLDKLGLAKTLEVQRVGRSDLFSPTLALHDGASLPLADLGYGLSQILPVLTQCSFADEGSTLLFEQPEIHLHSLAMQGLAKVFVETAREKHCHLVIETHSKEMVAQIQRELRGKRIKLDDVAVYKVRRTGGSSTISKVTIESDDYDIFDDWEKGVTIN